MSETTIDIPEQLQQIGKTIQDYKEVVVSHFKDMEVEIKDWNFNVGKTEEEYNVEVKVKLTIKPKKKQ
jgi:hypothetical protein